MPPPGKTRARRPSAGNPAIKEEHEMSTVDVKTEITGNVWKVLLKPGDTVEEDEPIIILESMKMEIPVVAPEAGTIAEILVQPEQTISEGSVVARLTV
jgi:acetyl-CoA carboxylase biotin carboxyl carrier protein